MHRVELAHPQEAPRLRERLHRAGAPTYEADVRFAYRYHGNPTLSAGEWSRTVVFDEPSLEPADWTSELTTLSLDLETDAEAKHIYSVALWGCGAREVLLWCPDEDARAACPSGATPCADESELLTLLCRRIRELDPDVLTGWSIIRLRRPGPDSAGGGRRRGVGHRPRARGAPPARRRCPPVQRFDLHPGADAAGRHPPAARRRAAAAGLQPGNRLPPHPGRREDVHCRRSRRRDPARLCAGSGAVLQYNLTDARLAFDILDKLKLVPFTVQRSRLTGPSAASSRRWVSSYRPSPAHCLCVHGC